MKHITGVFNKFAIVLLTAGSIAGLAAPANANPLAFGGPVWSANPLNPNGLNSDMVYGDRRHNADQSHNTNTSPALTAPYDSTIAAQPQMDQSNSNHNWHAQSLKECANVNFRGNTNREDNYALAMALAVGSLAFIVPAGAAVGVLGYALLKEPNSGIG